MQVVVAVIPILAGLLVGVGGYQAYRGRLSRQGVGGVRTSATLRSDEAFAAGNRIGGIPTMAAGVIGVGAGLAAFAMPSLLGAVVAAVLGLAGLAGLITAGVVAGNRVAAAVPEPAPAAGCGGCACGAGGCAATG